jgi:hypothetical protein
MLLKKSLANGLHLHGDKELENEMNGESPCTTLACEKDRFNEQVCPVGEAWPSRYSGGEIFFHVPEGLRIFIATFQGSYLLGKVPKPGILFKPLCRPCRRPLSVHGSKRHTKSSMTPGRLCSTEILTWAVKVLDGLGGILDYTQAGPLRLSFRAQVSSQDHVSAARARVAQKAHEAHPGAMHDAVQVAPGGSAMAAKMRAAAQQALADRARRGVPANYHFEIPAFKIPAKVKADSSRHPVSGLAIGVIFALLVLVAGVGGVLFHAHNRRLKRRSEALAMSGFT